jgi:hypothetical protein
LAVELAGTLSTAFVIKAGGRFVEITTGALVSADIPSCERMAARAA